MDSTEIEPPPARPRARRLLLFLLAVALAAPLHAATYPPRPGFHTVVHGRVSVHYQRGLESTAREAASVAAEMLDRHAERYGVKVRRLHLVVTDVDDDANGFATPLPYPLVHIRVAAPSGAEEFGNYESWLRLVLSHEIAHVAHLEKARGLLGFGRKVFGRAPFLFPNTLTPGWMIEGLATYEETEATAFGRGRDADTRMVVRMAALEDRFPSEAEAVGALDAWPGGRAQYVFGEAFLRDLSRRFGAETLPELARVHAGRILPFLDDRTAKKVTGGSFHRRWQEWMVETRRLAAEERAALVRAGLTRRQPLPTRGVAQTGPRFSPDGSSLAYTSRSLTRYREIRTVAADGGSDRRLLRRNGGAGLSWTPDGRFLVYDEPEVHHLFWTFDDLRVVEVATRRVRRLTRGLRASEPDVSREGQVVFVRRHAGGSELAVIPLAGGEPHTLTRSEPDTQWSHPRWSPDGGRIAAARWTSGGWLDVVLVDPATGEVEEVTHDRAKDVEPAWTADGAHLLFRSDRDGISNIYAWRRADGALLRVTRVAGGAFTPEAAPDGASLVYSDYSARGYGLQQAALDLASAEPAPVFVAERPSSHPAPEPVEAAERAYRPFPAALPRFWSPYAATVADDTRLGALTAGADPLLRHVYGLDVHRGLESEAFGAQGFYQYDRFRPTLLAVFGDTRERDELAAGVEVERMRELQLEVSLPLRRTLRSSHELALAWRGRRDGFEGVLGPPEELDFSGLELAWAFGSARSFPFSISPVEGARVRLAALKELPGLGSDVSLLKATADVRAYRRLFGETDALALRATGGFTAGRPGFQRSFRLGGYPSGTLFDVIDTNHAVLRGYGQDRLSGRHFLAGNAEYRFPLGHPQGGWRLLPVFVRHLHAAVFVDAGHAWSEAFRLADVRSAAGASLGADLVVGHALPLTGVVSLAHGFAREGETRLDLRLGLAF